jgi:hypothetical protein
MSDKTVTGDSPTTEAAKPTAPRLQYYSPAQARRALEGKVGALPSSIGWFVLTRWLRGYEQSVIEVIVAPFFTGDPLDPAEQMLAAVPGVYRIARLDRGGSFGRERGDNRRQVRALMALTDVALQRQPLGRGGWAAPWAAPDGTVVYDPRARR